MSHSGRYLHRAHSSRATSLARPTMQHHDLRVQHAVCCMAAGQDLSCCCACSESHSFGAVELGERVLTQRPCVRTVRELAVCKLTSTKAGTLAAKVAQPAHAGCSCLQCWGSHGLVACSWACCKSNSFGDVELWQCTLTQRPCVRTLRKHALRKLDSTKAVALAA